MLFNLEDRVVIIGTPYEVLTDKECIIKDIIKDPNGNRYGVEFEEDLLLHDMNGKAKKGSGWYVREEDIQLASQSKLCRMVMKFQSALDDIKANNKMVIDDIGYQIRQNGALTFLTSGEEKIFVFNSNNKKVILNNCDCDEDRVAILHLLEYFRFLPMLTLDNPNDDDKYVWLSYTKEQSDELEAELYHEHAQSVEPPTLPDVVTPFDDQPEPQYFETEEELYASLGISRK